MTNTGKQPASEVPEAAKGNRKRLVKWWKRIGIAGFLFFLIKGILWILVFLGAFRYFGCES